MKVLDWLFPWRKTNEEIEKEITIRERKVEEHTMVMQGERLKNGFAGIFIDAGLGVTPHRKHHHHKGRKA